MTHVNFIILNDICKFEKINPKNNGSLGVAFNKEKSVDNIFKKLVVSDSISEETRTFLKPVGNRPGMIYGLCKVNEVLSIISRLFGLFCQQLTVLPIN